MSFSTTKISFPDSIEIDDNVTSRNAEPSMNRTFPGITIDSSDEYENASDSIRVKCEFDLNEIDESEKQDVKHFNPRISTLLRILIDWSDENANACDSIHVKREFDSNVIDESEEQFEKQDEPRISIFRGIMIDLSDDDENADDSIRFNCEFDSNVIDESD
jgi:hypothetical protein